MVQIQAVQSVMPTKQTDPRQSHRLIIPPNLSSFTFIQRHFNIVLCYDKASTNDSGWVMAGWIKESLGRALSEEPIFSGRLRKSNENGGDWHIVSNDSGARLLEGRIDVNLADFLDLKGKREVEAELVFWEDVQEQEPQFSPLFYVQVTNFTCGGYSIGISCSLILADPFALKSFIKRWTNLHKCIVSQTHKIPTFFLPKLGKPDASPTLLMGSNKSKIAANSIIFNIPNKILNLDKDVTKNLAALCIDEAESALGKKMASRFSLFVKVTNDDLKVEICSREGIGEKQSIININGLTCASIWDEVKVDKICFNEGNQAMYGSCWINSIADESCVMIIGLDDVTTSGMKIVVTFT